MLRTYEAMIDEQGRVRLLAPVHLDKPQRAIVTILEEQWTDDIPETALLSEPALSKDWNRPEEETAWLHLQPAQSS